MQKISYEKRVELTPNPAAKRLFQLMASKETNLILANDESETQRFLQLTDEIGPEICVLKTHIDILRDFTPKVISTLLDLSRKHKFMIFEDRKFADIGNTAKLQYAQGIYHIAEWADIVNAHSLPGPGVVEGLKQVAEEKNLARGLILLAQMSSKGSLFTEEYARKTIEMANQYPDFVCGFIGNGGNPDELKKFTEQVDPKFIIMTPGVNLATAGDDLKQTYATPDKAIEAGSDAIIVGRGIYRAEDPVKSAREYRKAGWEAYRHVVD